MKAKKFRKKKLREKYSKQGLLNFKLQEKIHNTCNKSETPQKVSDMSTKLKKRKP